MTVLCTQRHLRRIDPAIWGIFPLAYFPHALARGRAEGPYTYPFIDVAELGWLQALTNTAVIALGFMVAGYALVWLDRRLA